MNREEGLNILIQVANLACERGILKLQDARAVAEAVDVFIKPTAEEQLQAIQPNEEVQPKEKGNKLKKA